MEKRVEEYYVTHQNGRFGKKITEKYFFYRRTMCEVINISHLYEGKYDVSKNRTSKRDDYVIDRLIGTGTGHVEVFSGWDRSLSKAVAIKVLDLHQSDCNQITNEIAIRKLLDSEMNNYYPKIFDSFQENGYQYIVMELAQYDLFHVIETKGKLGENLAKNCFRQILEGVDYLHKRMIAHRDLKLENILIKHTSKSNNTFRLLLTDFGLSSHFENGSTKVNDCSGTLNYLSPEEIRTINDTNYDSYCALKCDIWSLGILLYVMLQGVFPFTNVRDVLNHKWKPIYRGISIMAQDLIEKMLNFSPLGRPSTVELLQHPWLLE